MRTKKTMLLGVIFLLVVLLGACAAPPPTPAPIPTPTPAPTPTPTPAPAPPAPETVVFADENLEAAIRDALGKPAGEAITPAEMTGLTSLMFSSCWSITDLSGIEYCTNPTVLDLSVNQISDISPLASLTNLPWLNLRNNEISDVSPLASLTNLTWLILYNNQISDISPLASLTNLTTLNLSMNPISDIFPLVENSGLGEGAYVLLENNNLDLSEGSEALENIRQLEGRGVMVQY